MLVVHPLSQFTSTRRTHMASLQEEMLLVSFDDYWTGSHLPIGAWGVVACKEMVCADEGAGLQKLDDDTQLLCE